MTATDLDLSRAAWRKRHLQQQRRQLRRDSARAWRGRSTRLDRPRRAHAGVHRPEVEGIHQHRQEVSR